MIGSIFAVVAALFLVLGFLVALRNRLGLVRDVYRYLRRQHIRKLKMWLWIRLTPGWLRQFYHDFTERNIQIQLEKLKSGREEEQINALQTLEQILNSIEAAEVSTSNGENVRQIRCGICEVLSDSETSRTVVRKAMDLLCENDSFQHFAQTE
jgi:hypothetical protein